MRKPGFILATGAFLLGFLVVLLGAYTRLVHAGLGCPDWPGCYGFLGVPSGDSAMELAQLRFPDHPVEIPKAWAEMLHRYVAGLLGLLILGLALIALKHRNRDQYPLKLPLGLLALVICQALFGMWTVTLKLWPQVVTAHLLGGFATLSLLFVLSLRLSGRLPADVGLTALRPLARITLLVVVGQILLGGWTSSNYAAVACLDFPTCHGQWWPDMDFLAGFNVFQEIGPNYLGGMLDSAGRTAIHFTHRIGALLTAASVIFLAWRLHRAGMTATAAGLTLVLLAQLALGVTNVLAHLPLTVAVAHNGVAALLLLSVVLVNYQVRPAPMPIRRQRPSQVGQWTPS